MTGGWSRRRWLGALAPFAAAAQAPYRTAEPMPRSYDAPARVAEAAIGLFGPGDARHETGGTIYCGVALALEEANRGGGFRGAPFRLISRWHDDPWRGGASAVVKLAYADNVAGVIGGLGGETAHLAAQIAAKALLPVVDAVGTDESVNQAGLPWIFSCAPGDSAIAAWMKERAGGEACALACGIDHDSRRLGAKAQAALPNVARRVEVDADEESAAALLAESGARVAVVIARARTTAAVARMLPGPMRVLGGPAAASRLYAAQGGRRVETPVLRPGHEAIRQAVEKRFGVAADVFAVLAYDAARALVESIREAGLDRARVRDRLAARFGPRGRHLGSTV
jgi:ABC-type branched-subunit amino acid transport system substrate-binding protein